MYVSLSDLILGATAGKLVSFPTDTVPALAAKPDASPLIFEAKQRSQDKPLILMAATADDLWDYIRGSDREFAIWQDTADRYWPGAVTLVLPASDRVPAVLNPNDPTSIGVRVPNSPIARQILAGTGPLATTSANRSGEPALQAMADIDAAFPEVRVLYPSEAGETSGQGIPSTVVKWTETGWEILRQGAVIWD
jgi:L-threonylcarbamoyladenylate synthase